MPFLSDPSVTRGMRRRELRGVPAKASRSPGGHRGGRGAVRSAIPGRWHPDICLGGVWPASSLDSDVTKSFQFERVSSQDKLQEVAPKRP